MCDSYAEPFIIGGAHVYKESIPVVTTMYLTMVNDLPEDADTFFPNFDRDQWEELEHTDPILEPDAPSYRFVTIRRK